MLKIALPVMIQNFITSLINMVDTVMVGRLGETEIAAIGIANQFFFIFLMFMLGLGAGCGVFIAQFWGKRDSGSIGVFSGSDFGRQLFFPQSSLSLATFFPAVLLPFSIRMRRLSTWAAVT